MKTCENCGHQKVCSFFNDWPNCPHWEPKLVHCGECKGWNDKEWANENCPLIRKAEQCLIDNGIEADEAETVLQALGYILLDEELYPER